MTEEILMKIFGDVPFAAIAFYVLTKMNSSLERMAESVDRLERRIERLEEKFLKQP